MTTNTRSNIISRRLDRVKHLPEPDVEQRQNEFHDRLMPMFKQLCEDKILEKADTVELAEDRNDTVHLWRTRPEEYERIQSLLDARPEHDAPRLPCGDSGFENTGDQLVCQFDDCDGAWSKHELRHFWEHGELPDGDADPTGAIAGD